MRTRNHFRSDLMIPTVKIDVTIDINCPFSYLGVLHLLSAIEKYHTSQPNANFEPIIRLLPYNLDENLTERPLPRAEYRKQRLGLERAALAEKNFMDKFAAIGVDANSGGLISSPHLFNRILTHALFIAPETQLPIALQLFHAIHVDARHPSDRALIADAAVEHGLFPTITKAMLWMDRDECDAQVRRAYVTARRLGVTGVPFYVFEDRWALSGLHGVEEFVSLFDKLSRGTSSSTPSPTTTVSSPEPRKPLIPSPLSNPASLSIVSPSSTLSPTTDPTDTDQSE